ncbi:MAG: hypothetical protein J6Y04_02065 [Bacteroidaceae bacterium]|nr:hypothetical protein [Bacteroidaceae bacterium]
MKKFLLSLIALLGVVSANAQVTTTDVSGYEYAIYAESLEAAVGTTAKLPIYMKNAETVASFQFQIVLPADLADTFKKAGLNADRFNADNGGTVFDANKQPDGSVMVIATVLHDDGFTAADAPILYLDLPISSTMAAGEYPIIVKATELSGVGGVGSRSEKITEEIVSKLTIVDFVTLDENSTTVPEEYVGNVLVKRSIKAGQWSTICLPFAIDDPVAVFGDGVELADFTDYEETYDEAEENVISIAVHFSTVTSMEANHPYIIKVTNPVTYEDGFKVEDATLEPSQDDAIVEYDNGLTGKRRVVYGTFYGTYVAETVVPENSLFISNNKFFYSTGATKMKAFRGYFDFVDEIANKVVASTVKMQFDVDGTTKIDDLHLVDTAGAVYTVDGKFIGRDVDLKKLQKGIYVIDGKKVAIK